MTVEMTPTLHALDWCGCGLGLLGAYLLAFNMRRSRYGWFAFLAANVAYIALTKELGIGGMLLQQTCYMGSSLLGIYRAFLVRPKISEQDVDQEHAWHISARLAAVPPSVLLSSPADLAALIREAQLLHPEMAQGALVRELRGEPSALLA